MAVCLALRASLDVRKKISDAVVFLLQLFAAVHPYKAAPRWHFA